MDIQIPWKQQNWKGWRYQLRGPPFKLFIICIAEILVLLMSVFGGLNHMVNILFLIEQQQKCEINTTNAIDLDCSTCEKSSSLGWGQIFLLTVGLFIMPIGILSAIFRSRRLCQIYSASIMVFSFIVGVCSLLIGLSVAPIHAAITNLVGNLICREDAKSMLHSSIFNCIAFALNAIVDIIGSIYAIKTKSSFDFEEIHQNHTQFERSRLL